MVDTNTSGSGTGVSAAPPKGAIEVKRARSDGAIEDAPLDLRVHLAEPDLTRLAWKEFVVKQGKDKRFLVPVSGPLKPGTFIRPRPLWCVWAPDTVTLKPGSSYSEVPPFGFPLLARFPDQKTLVLPNLRIIQVIYFN